MTLTRDMINLLFGKMRGVTWKLQLPNSLDVNDVENVRDGLNAMADYALLLHGHLKSLKMELKKKDNKKDNNNKKDNP